MPRTPAKSPRPAIVDTVDARIVLVLFDLANHLQRRGERIAAQTGITSLQWIVLLQIAGDPNFHVTRRGADASPVLASEIARERGLSKPTISAVVTALRRRGLIREERAENDGRRRHLVLTPAGSRAIAAMEPLRAAANGRLFADLTGPDRRRLLHYLEQCIAVLWMAYEDEQLAAARKRSSRVRGAAVSRSSSPA